MLCLKHITKDYPTGSETVHALRGIDLDFRESEFVSILGPSGCGKTTLLNIIGGLDQYTSGDLLIDGRSTKDFRDRDWDAYRNHSVGFVFQSYNLIPHQSVLQNVELALTLSGVPKAERRARAKRALEQVGLGDQLGKKPAEMSGGQMQRVAIARALVNEPDIILADEPTGALDTETSVQVMELLGEIARERLVVMVTHNPELAERYSTRIIRMLDGTVRGDTRPLTEAELAAEGRAAAQKAEREGKKKKPSMRLTTAFGLSLKNLFTKKGRTALTSFAGSIGIIGIALIYAVSQGTNDYIDAVQQDTLSTYPLTIMAESADMTALLSAFGNLSGDSAEQPENTVAEQQLMSRVFAQIGSNDLQAFKRYLDAHEGEVTPLLSAMQLSYGVTPLIYSADTSAGAQQLNPGTLLSGGSFGMAASFMNTDIFREMMDDRALLTAQYDVLAGRWPEQADELLLVLGSSGSMSDYMAYSLGLRDRQELTDMMAEVADGAEVEARDDPMRWSYDELMALRFKLVAAAGAYRYNDEYGVWEDMSDDEAYMKALVEGGETLRVVGIVCPKAGVAATALQPGIAYTAALTSHVMEQAAAAPIVKSQLADRDTDVFSGKQFEALAEESSGLDFNDMISVDTDALASAFGSGVDADYLKTLISGYMSGIEADITADPAPAKAAFTDTLAALTQDMLARYGAAHADAAAGTVTFRIADAAAAADDCLASPEAAALLAALEQQYVLPAASLKQIYAPLLQGGFSGFTAALPGFSLASPDTVAPQAAADAAIPAYAAAFPAAALQDAAVSAQVDTLARTMTEAAMKKSVLGAVGELSQKLIGSVAGAMTVDADKIASAFHFKLDESELTRLMQSYSGSGSDRSADANLRSLGYARADEPTALSFYLTDFTAKEKFIAFIDAYNASVETAGDEELVISYTDTTGILMSSVKTVVDSVSYVLIAFVAISLVVSSIMIGVITLISVQERTKEIGILRALGASKRNVSSMFNAETVLIGAAAGLLGVGITALLCLPINAILRSVTGIASLTASLPLPVATTLVLISVGLTLIAGIIPSRSAAKKDPVVALRSE